MSKEKLIILFTVLVDVIGFGIVIPILPFYVQSFDAKPWVITLLFAVFSLFAFISTPFLGSLSDKIGRKPILLVSILSTALGWVIFALAHNITLLFLGRIIDGLAAGNFSTAQSAISDLAKNEKERTHNLGMLGAVFGIGFILGPMIGGLLAAFSHRTPFWFVAILAFLNFILAFVILPETNKNQNRAKKMNFNPLKPIIQSARNKKERLIYSAWFLFSLSFATMQAIMALYVGKVFGWGATISGWMMTGVGVIIALNQGFGLKHIWLKHFPEPVLEIVMLLALSIGFFLMDWKKVIVFLIALGIASFAQSVLRVIITSQMVSRGEKNRQGETLGVLAAIMSLAMIIGPASAGFLFQKNISLPFFFSGLYGLIAFVLAICNRRFLKLKKNLLNEEITVPPAI